MSEQELEFQKWLKLYREEPKKEYQDQIWIRVYEACKAKLAAYYKNVPNHPYFEDRVLDAVEKVMKYIIVDGKNPDNLGKYVAWPVYGAAYNKKAIEIDSQVSYEGIVEAGFDIGYEDEGINRVIEGEDYELES